MQIVNLGNNGRHVYLFIRDNDGNLKIKIDKGYYPSYFLPSETGSYNGYYGGKYRKFTIQDPFDLKRSPKGALGKDIPYLKRYLIERCPKLTKTNLKYIFFDIEILTDTSVNMETKDKPISCISVYNNFKHEIKSFYMRDYSGGKIKREKQLIKDFCDYIKAEKPDLLLQYSDFDMPYLFGRYPKAAKHMSPVGMDRWSWDCRLPVGISVLDYMEMFKKFTLNKRESYALDSILEEEFGYGKDYKEVDFNKLSDELLLRNREDVKHLAKLENKYKIIDYFDEIRIITKTFWEDLPSRIIKKENNWVEVSNNSKIIEALALQKMFARKIIPPIKKSDKEKVEFDGAFRETYEKGRFTNLSKFDLGSAYPAVMKTFCLDTNNFVLSKDTDTVEIKLKDRKTGIHSKTYYVKQDSQAITCQLANDLLNLKDKIKKQLNSLDPTTDEHKKIATKYAAIKSVVNSYYGAYALQSFIISDNRVSEITTFLVRDLLEFCIEKVKVEGYKIVFVDTDSIVSNLPLEYETKLNEWISEWAASYGVDAPTTFTAEGYFSSIVVTGKCRYIGDLVTPNGIDREVKGIETKRRDASQATKDIQAEIFERILGGAGEVDIRQYVKEQECALKKRPLKDISFPFKLKMQEYKSEPIYVRAYRNTNLYKPFELKLGYVGYYAYIHSLGYDENKKPIDVLAFREEDKVIKSRINWNKMIERNITNKYKVICEAMDWNFIRTNQLTFEEV